MADILNVARRAMRALVIGFFLTTALPLLLGRALGIPVGTVLMLVGSTLVLQANGVFIGLRAGLTPPAVLGIMILVELGAVLAIYEILGAFEE